MAYTIGKKLRDDGIWRDFNGAQLLIGRAGSTDFLQCKDELERPYRKRIDRGTLSASKQRELNTKAIAKSILLDWKNVEDESGNAVPYDDDIGYTALSNDPDLLEFVIDVSVDNDNYALAQETKTAKKSQPPKSG